jgi:hypothetical protein
LGLDISYYDKNNKQHYLGEISEGLHSHIFYGNVRPENLGILRKIKEYYGADSVVILNRPEIEEFIIKLLSIKELVPDRFSNEIDELVIILQNEEFDKIKFAGD